MTFLLGSPRAETTLPRVRRPRLVAPAAEVRWSLGAASTSCRQEERSTQLPSGPRVAWGWAAVLVHFFCMFLLVV